MIQNETRLKVADNTGAREILCIRVKGGSRRRYAGVGDVITANIKEGQPGWHRQEGRGRDAVVVRTRSPSAAMARIAFRFERGRHHRRGKQPARHAHLRPGGPRASRPEVHEDHFARAGGHLSMQKSHVKKGDEVVVISGADKGKRGKIIE